VLTRMLEETAERYAERTALVWQAERISYAELVRAVAQRAGELEALGVGPGRVVALLLPNAPDFVVHLFAIAARGAVVVPINPQLKPEEVTGLLRGCDIALAVAAPSAADSAKRALALLDSDAPVQESTGAETLRATGDPAPLSHPAADADVLHGFSSGSTGAPKRIVRTHANLVAESRHFTTAVGLDADDVILGTVPFFHAHGLGNCVQAAAMSGATLVIREFEPRPVLDTLVSERVTVYPGVPFVFRMLAETRTDALPDLSSLRLCFSAGAALPMSVFDAFEQRFGVQLRQLYGCSEAGSVCINLDPDVRQSRETVGTAMPGVDLAIVDERGARCTPGLEGEITFASPALGRPGEPEHGEAFRDGRFQSGDLGRLDAAGRLEITGRKKLYISTAASKVDPVEVERCIADHPAVREVIVLGVKSRGDDEIVKAVVVAPDVDERARQALRRELVARCREHLASFKVPRQVEFRAEIPRSPLGKVLRKDLL
jgi:long-chain acyl-CoA synthetase